jgi:hypothetical protein
LHPDAVRVEHDRERRVLAEADPAALGQVLEFAAQHRLRPVRAALAPFGGRFGNALATPTMSRRKPITSGWRASATQAAPRRARSRARVVGLAERHLVHGGGHRRVKPVELVVDNREEEPSLPPKLL